MDILTRSGSLRASVNPSDSSKCIRSVMQAGRLELHFSSSKPIPFALGDYADFEGDRYTLCYPSEVSKVQREWLEYTLVLHSSAEELKQRLVKSPEGETKVDFVMVGSPTDHLRLITRAMGEGWSVGTSLEAGDRLVAYKSDTCYAALCRLAEEYKTEWVVKGKTISLRREELWRDDPVAMSYGKGMGFLSGVSRSGDGDKLPISRLYVVGGSRNIDPAAYGSRSLHLPDGSTALSSGVEGREAALDLSHIYPSRVGTVSEVVTVSEEKCFYDIKDDSIPADLNYSDCRIPGEKAVIRFQSGALAGRELEIRQSESALEGYHHEERRFELVPREEDGFTFPSTRWMPKAGDKYAVFGIALPPSYIKEAEERMLREAKRYLSDNMEPVYTFWGEVDGIWARAHWLEVGGKLVPGGHVLFSDPEFHPSGSVIRIVSTTQAVNDPHAPSITLSTAPVPGSILSRLDRVEADEVVRREQIREVQRQQSQSYRQALEHLSMVDRAVEGLEGFTRRLKPSVIETMGILVGSQATQLDFVRAVGSLESVTPAVNFDPDDKALHIGESVLRHQTIGITTMRDRRDPSEYRYWRLPEYVSPPLTDPDRSYYIYARAARVGTEGAFLLSEEPIPMESDPDYFHLLIGTLSSLDGGDRAYNRLYGFSMISPGQMVVDTISSANGRMSIDLARGEIYASSVSFSRPDGGRASLSDLAGEVDELQSHPPKIVDGKWHVWDGKAQTYVNTGDTARGETGKNGLAPKIVDDKWSVWDGTRWVSTGVPAQGPKGEQGDKGEKGEQGAPGKDVDPKVLNDLKTAVDDARRKLDDTVTKAELDGVVSAQEEHDIQAAKAALDAAKKAYDDAVKRAKELDDALKSALSKEIDAAKEQADKAQTSTDNLRGYVDGAYKDGIITEVESKAIATYINEVEAMWSSAFGAYERVYVNPLLTGTPKTALSDAKITLAGAKDNLVGQIKSAISDGKATKAEATETERLYNVYKSALRDFQRALKVAEESIRDAGKTTGGRNLVIMSRMIPGYLYGESKKGNPGDKDYKVMQYGDFVYDPTYYKWEGATPLTYRIQSVPKGRTGMPIIHYHDKDKRFIGWEFDWSYQPPGYTKTLAPKPETAYIRIGFVTPQAVVKIERGTVATDWTPAPEDLQAAIEEVAQAKAELAETKSKAYADGKITATEQLAIDKAAAAYKAAIKKAKELDDALRGALSKEINVAKEQADKAQTSTDNLRGYVDGAYKDGIITEVESKAIATYINEVEAMWSSAFGAYERVYVNPLLTGTPKTALSDAKITLAGAKDNLVGQIKSAISDGKATKAEATETERLYNVYKSALRDFQRALKVAEESIRDAGKTTGGRNLVIMSRMIPGYLYGESKKGNPGDKDYKVMQYGDFVYDPTYYKWEGATPLTYRIQSVPKGRTGMPIIHYHDKDKRFIGWEFDWSYQPPGYTKTLAPKPETAYIRIGFVTPQAVVKIERGTVATDWTPAPEDLQAAIDAERAARETAVREVATGLSSATTLIESLQRAQDLKLDRNEMPEIGYLLAALKKPKGTTVAGGLLLSNQIILSDAEDDIISATLSGQRAKGAKSLRLGIDYTDGKDAGTEQTALCNDGTGHLGDLYFGGEEIGFGDKDRRYMQIGGTARSEYDMVNASTEIHKSKIPGTTVYKAGETLLDNFYLPGSNSELKYTAMISARADAEAQRRIVMEGGGPDGNPHFGGGYQRPERVIYYDRCSVTTSAYLRVTITRGGEEVYSATSPTVTARAVATGGRFTDERELTPDERFDSESQEQAVTLTVPANIIRPNDFAKLTLVCSELRADRGGGGSAYASNIVSYLPYDTSKPMVAVTKDKAAFFYGRSKYILLNYLRDCVMKVVGNMIIQGNLILKGDLTAEYADFPGVPLIGGMVTKDGIFKKSFGRYKNQSGRNFPHVSYDYSSKVYTVYHSIGNDKYIPVVTPMEHRWGDTLSISNVSSSSFQVQLTNGNQDRNQCAFTYVCCKAD